LKFEHFESLRIDSNKCDLRIATTAAIIMGILAAIFNMVTKTHKQFRSAPMPSKKITRHFQIAFVTITFLMWEKPYISIFIEIGALRNFTHDY
jgi:hypothetical protein